MSDALVRAIFIGAAILGVAALAVTGDRPARNCGWVVGVGYILSIPFFVAWRNTGSFFYNAAFDGLSAGWFLYVWLTPSRSQGAKWPLAMAVLAGAQAYMAIGYWNGVRSQYNWDTFQMRNYGLYVIEILVLLYGGLRGDRIPVFMDMLLGPCPPGDPDCADTPAFKGLQAKADGLQYKVRK